MKEFKVNPSKLKSVWIEESKEKIEEFSKLNLNDYLKKRKQVIRSFCNFYKQNKEKIEKNEYLTVIDFLNTYKEGIEEFHNLCGIDFALDRDDVFNLWSSLENRVKKANPFIDQEIIKAFINNYFGNQSLENYPMVRINNVLGRNLERNKELYNLLAKQQQDENSPIFLKYDPLINKLEYLAEGFLVKLGINPKKAAYMPSKEKIAIIKKGYNL